MTSYTANSDVDSRAQVEAEHWFVRLLDADADSTVRAELSRWLAAHPGHSRAYRGVERLWASSQEAAHHPDVMAEVNRALGVTQASSCRRMRNWLAPALAATVTLVAMLALGSYWWDGATFYQTNISYSTHTGQQRTVRLPDGSKMLLDTHSAVRVRYSRKARGVDLLHGRVEFSVRHNRRSPFVVHAGAGTVTDLGTTFQAMVSKHNEVSVVLIKGKVSVATSLSSMTLTSGEATNFDRDGIIHSAFPADLPEALRWTHGEVVAHDWSLPQLLAEMNRYSNTKLEIQDTALREMRITGTFRVGDQGGLARVLEAGWPIRAKRVSPTKVVLRRD